MTAKEFHETVWRNRMRISDSRMDMFMEMEAYAEHRITELLIQQTAAKENLTE